MPEYYIKSIRFNRIEINLTNNKVNEKQFRLCGVGKPIDQELHVSHVRVRWLTHTQNSNSKTLNLDAPFGRNMTSSVRFSVTFLCVFDFSSATGTAAVATAAPFTAGARMCTGFSRTFIVTSFFEEHLGCLSPFGRHNRVWSSNR